jgi:hypothetical protein
MRSDCGFLRGSVFIGWCLAALSVVTPGSVSAERSPTAVALEQKLQALSSDLRARLSIPEPVVVSIVPSEKLMMSVKAPAEAGGPFLLAIDATFLDTLTDDELEAAIAHELGHVWVFTHHPYLQTEELANQIAMRVVSRESLERVYGKVWERGGTKGDLVRFLGPAPATALASDTKLDSSAR